MYALGPRFHKSILFNLDIIIGRRETVRLIIPVSILILCVYSGPASIVYDQVVNGIGQVDEEN